MNCRESQDLMPVYLDGELDASASVAIERHLRECSACRELHDSQRALSTAVREHGSYFAAPAELRARISQEAQVSHGRRRLPFALLGASAAMACTLVLAWSLAVIVRAPDPAERIVQEVVAGHARSLMANHLTDVASSDQHTVKPWLSAKLDFSPPVKDLSAHGFELAGGRLDYVNQRPVAALVYRQRQHVINLFAWPEASGAAQDTQTWSRQGYQIARFARGGMTYWAVSDLNPAEFGQFVALAGAP